MLAMELLNLIISAFFVAFSFQLASCASDDQVIVQTSLKQYGNSGVHQVQFTLPLLPRKLKLLEAASVKSLVDKETTIPHKKLLMGEASSGNKQNEKEASVVHHAARKGTWREWVEGPSKSEYFTMDYSWVRRRRPIHNKQIPFIP